MPWLHGLKRARLLKKDPIISGIPVKNQFNNNKKKKTDPDPQQSSGRVLKEHCVGVSFLIDLQLC